MSINPRRRDPYKNFKFRIKVDGRVVAGVSKVSKLKQTTEVIGHRTGGALSTSPTSSRVARFEPITLEAGVTHDAGFDAWADKASAPKRGTRMEATPADTRDIIIEMIDEKGGVASAYRVTRCWVSACTSSPDPDAASDAVQFRSITLQHEGLEQIPVAAPNDAKKR